jgi:hypothetical protein
MLQEKPRDAMGWKQRLDELDQLPGEAPLDKSAAWPVLHERLRKKPAHLKPMFYWAAAALLIIVIISRLLVAEYRESGRVIEDTQVYVKPTSPVEHKKPSGSPAIVAAKKQVHKPSVTRNNKTQVDRTPQPVMIDPVVISEHPVTVTRDVYTEKKPDTATMVAVTPVKQRLRVVHINELSKPLPEPGLYVSKKNVKRSDGTGDAYPNFIVSRNASDDLIKIKLTPPN